MFKQWSFYLLLISAFVMLSIINFSNHQQFDISRSQHNSISAKSIDLLKQFEGNIHFSVYANKSPLKRKQIKQWFDRYQHEKKDLTIEWINPETSPTIARELDITVNGTVIINYKNKQQRIERISETSISNAFFQLQNRSTKSLVFLTGHGERSPIGDANHDWKDFASKLAQKGLFSDTRNLFKQSFLDAESEILVLASPLTEIFEQERQLINDFIKQGGNVLITTDPNKFQPLDFLFEQLNIAILPGTIVDVTTQNLGIDNVDFAVVSEYTGHPVTRDFTSVTLFPETAALDILVNFDLKKNDWDIFPLLSTLENSWTETSKIEGDIAYNENTTERAGPLDIGLLLTKDSRQNTQQRIMVLGDGDFVANAYMGNGGNLPLALKIFQWLSSNDHQLVIDNQLPVDLEFELSEEYRILIGVGFLVVLPLAFLLIGFIIQVRRRRR